MDRQTSATAAETALVAQYESASAALPGTATVRDARDAAIGRFRESGLPHRRVEAWKYTDLRAHLKAAYPLAEGGDGVQAGAIDEALGALALVAADRFVIVDGRFDAGLSQAGGDGLQVMPLASALAEPMFADMHGRLEGLPAEDAAVGLNTAFMRDGVALHIASSPERPLHIVHVTSGANEQAVTTRNVVYVGKGVSLDLIESHVTLGAASQQTNALTHIGIDEEADVNHVKLMDETGTSTHLGTWIVDVAKAAKYVATQMTLGGALTRNQIFLRFSGADAVGHLNGAFMQRGAQHCDTTLVVDHIEPGCESRELFKGVLDDNARGVFQGKIMVKPEAQKTDGKQMSQALLLSETAEFDAKPELEIFADDVACGHGATSGRIDDDHLFYLMARGVPEAEAKALLIEAFVGEALDGVRDDAVRDALAERSRRWLHAA